MHRTITVRSAAVLLFLALTLVGLTGCGSSQYVTPSRAADLATLVGVSGSTDESIQSALGRRPAAPLPATIAIVRIQQADYIRHPGTKPAAGGYGVVTLREIEQDADLDRLRKLSGVAAVAPITGLLVPPYLPSEAELRRAAATLRADLVLIYTIESKLSEDDFAPPLGLLTLGLLPTRVKSVSATAAMALTDTRTGFVYSVAEASADADQLANGWTGKSALEDARLRAERRAFDSLLGQFEQSWPRIMASLGTGTGSPPIPVGSDANPAPLSGGHPVPPGTTYQSR
jgi:hypothetical protein